MNPSCDHIGFLVEDLEAALEVCVALDLPAGPIEEFPGEGTREVYLGRAGQAARLLLLQAIGPEGPYRRALEKRGPGLHHIAFHVPSAAAFFVANPGWLLHPRSLTSLPETRTAWAARPGIGALLEVHQSEASYQGAPLVSALAVSVRDASLEPMVTNLSCETAFTATRSEASLTIAGEAVPVAQLLGSV